MYILKDKNEKITLNDNQRDYLMGMGLISDLGDGYYETIDEDLEFIENQLIIHGLID